jgi:hypothetical protein
MMVEMNYRKCSDYFSGAAYDSAINRGICTAVMGTDEQAKHLYNYQLTRYVVRALIEDIQYILGVQSEIVLRDAVLDSADHFFYPDLETSLELSGVVLPQELMYESGIRINRQKLLDWLLANGETGRMLEINKELHPGMFDGEE